MTPTPLPESFASTRTTLQRVATHVLARRRHALVGRFGLRATPGGFGTPAGGPDHEVVRLAGTVLVRERTAPGATATTTTLDLTRSTLGEAAALVDVDLAEPFEVGHDTPPVGDPDAPLAVEADAAAALAAWFHLGWAVLDAAVADLGPGAEPSVAQLWPEHFDVGVDVDAGDRRRVNLGASPGDDHHPEPYLYVGPWGPERPGDPEFWNAAFGAVLPAAALRSHEDPVRSGAAFLLRGVALLGAEATGAADQPSGGTDG